MTEYSRRPNTSCIVCNKPIYRGKKCQRCGYNKFEILQVHHKDRNHQNNELENLELICPNCHYEEHYLEKSWLKKELHTGEVA